VDDSKFDTEGLFPGEPRPGDPIEDHESQGNGNSRKGCGGPCTPEGKAKSSKNARRHGIFSPDPTAGGESPEVYEGLLTGVRDEFRPSNLYKDELAALVAGELLALQRIARQITELINLKTRRIDPPPPSPFIKPIRQRTNWQSYKRPIEAGVALKHLELYNDAALLDSEVFDDTIRAVTEAGLKMPKFDPGGFLPYSVGFVRHLVATTAEANGMEVPTVVKRIALVLDEAL